jgi:hypothetical protein
MSPRTSTTIPKKTTTVKNLSYGHIMWFECSDIQLKADAIQSALDNNGINITVENRSSWFSFRNAWRRYSTAIRGARQGWLTRLVTTTPTKEVVAVVAESRAAEQLNFNHEYGLVMEGLTDHENIMIKCKCGVSYHASLIAGKQCPHCYSDLPQVILNILDEYQEDQNFIQTNNRAEIIRNYMKRAGVISLASTGRPFFHPALEGSQLEKFFAAVTEWGDRIIMIPLAQNSEMPRLAFEALSDELKVLHLDSNTWGDSTRERTRQVRLENLSEIRAKLEIYSGVLGEFKIKAEKYADEVKAEMLAVVLGKDKEQLKTEKESNKKSEKLNNE